MTQPGVPFAYSTRYTLFENPVILNCIIDGIGSRSKATLAKMMRVNKACLAAAAKLVYKDVTRIGRSGERLNVYLNRICVPHARRQLYKSSVQEMVIRDICPLRELDTPTMISLYPNLIKISVPASTRHGNRNTAQVILRRNSSSDYTFNTLSIQCPLSYDRSSSGEILALYGLNPTTGKGFNDIELTKLTFTGGKECFCYEDQSDGEDEEVISGYDLFHPIGEPNRILSPLTALKVLDLGKNPCAYAQLMNLADAVPGVTHLSVCCSSYREDVNPSDDLGGLAMKLRNLESLLFQQKQNSLPEWSLVTVIENLITFCHRIKEIQIPIDLESTKITAEELNPSLLKLPTRGSLKTRLDNNQLSKLKILIDGKFVTELSAIKFACLLLHSVSDSCEVEMVEGHDPSDHYDESSDLTERYGRYRDGVTWGNEVMAAKEFLLQHVKPSGGEIRKSWEHLGPVIVVAPAVGRQRVASRR